MSATAQSHPLSWARTHLTVLLLATLIAVLVATVAVLAVRVTVSNAPIGTTTGTTTGIHLHATDDGCLKARPGQPC